MTCIVGLVENGKVYVGGDSLSGSAYVGRVTTLHKVFRKGGFVIGYTSSFRMGQLLEHVVEFPESDVYDMHYMVSVFIEECRKVFKDHGYTTINDNQETGGSFLVAVSGQLFRVDNDFQVNQYHDGMFALGCGEDYALGALYGSCGQDPQKRIAGALEAAAYFSPLVGPPFVILEAE